ncbi:DUF4012 domain-containing protein [Rhodococcus sovatensis]|uniref:DUF4012 domain-containing protein n=1 Tax=Rhodococcus sovatensis TaxID=1805840 RepID=A0ABZ2PI65_9NOCA
MTAPFVDIAGPDVIGVPGGMSEMSTSAHSYSLTLDEGTVRLMGKGRPSSYDAYGGWTDTSSRRNRERRRRRSSARQRRHPVRRRILIGCGIGVVVVVALLGWLGYTAKTAYSDLNIAKNSASAARESVTSGNPDNAMKQAAEAVEASASAKQAADSPIWRLAAAVPFLGNPLDSVTQIIDVVDGLAKNVLEPAVQLGPVLDPSQLQSPDGRIDVQVLRDATPTLVAIADSADELKAQADAIPESSSISQIDDARVQLQQQVTDLASLLANTRIAAEVMPSMIGADGPRNYFMAFQTNAESRGTGGLIGGFAILSAVDGRVQVDDLASNKELSRNYDPIDLGPDFYKAYEQRFQATQNWQNSNVSPHFPYAGQIWQSMWQQETGQVIDGAIATDPVALSYILEVVGAVKLADGEVIDADNVVRITQSDAYFRFQDDQIARKQYLQNIAAAVVAKMQGDIKSPSALLDAIGKAASEGHLAIWSADPEIQRILGPTKVGHEVPDTAAPYAAVVVNNGAGGKLDYYLDRSVTYSGGSCEGTTRPTKVTASITNRAPAQDYPVYVAGRQNDSTRYDGPPGTNRSIVTLYATQGAVLKKATLNGSSLFLLGGGFERGHPIYYVPVVTEPGQTNVIEYEFEEPVAAGEPQAPIQPQTGDAESVVEVPIC